MLHKAALIATAVEAESQIQQTQARLREQEQRACAAVKVRWGNNMLVRQLMKAPMAVCLSACLHATMDVDAVCNR